MLRCRRTCGRAGTFADAAAEGWDGRELAAWITGRASAPQILWPTGTAVTVDALDWPVMQSKKAPRACVANVAYALRTHSAWQGVLAYNQFTNRVMARRPAPWETANGSWAEREWTETDDIRTAEWLQLAGCPIGHSDTRAGIQSVAEENGYHPVRDYLDGLRWDNVDRLDTWTTTFSRHA